MEIGPTLVIVALLAVVITIVYLDEKNDKKREEEYSRVAKEFMEKNNLRYYVRWSYPIIPRTVNLSNIVFLAPEGLICFRCDVEKRWDNKEEYVMVDIVRPLSESDDERPTAKMIWMIKKDGSFGHRRVAYI